MKCNNCEQPMSNHCKIHVVPCCPGKCSKGPGKMKPLIQQIRVGDILECPWTASPKRHPATQRWSIRVSRYGKDVILHSASTGLVVFVETGREIRPGTRFRVTNKFAASIEVEMTDG